MIEEIPRWQCWHAEGLIPQEYSSLCLRALVRDLNEQGLDGINVGTDMKLRLYAIGSKAAQAGLQCLQADGCEAKTEMTPELYQMLSERSL